MSVELFVDDDFPPSERSIGKDAFGEDEDGEPITHDIIWLRPHEFGKPGEITEDPCLFFQGTEAGDVIQGELGDCYLLGSLSVVAMHPQDIIEHLFLDDVDVFEDTGKCTMRFYKNGSWISVIIDTLIPCSVTTRLPIFARNKAPNELWVVFLEKAYAKLHGSYAALNSGSVAEALVDLSGGVSQKLLFTDPATMENAKNGVLWKKMLQYVEQNYLLCTSYNIAGKKFIKIRNPWGKGEWNGEWSDKSKDWEKNPEIVEALKNDENADFTLEEDGTFWMLWKDYISIYNKLYICRIFGKEYNQYLVHGKWEGKSAAASDKPKMGGKVFNKTKPGLSSDQEKRAEEHVGWHHRMNGDPQWFNNPQYRLTVSDRGVFDIFISLSQHDRRLGRKKRKESKQSDNQHNENNGNQQNHEKIWEEDVDDIVTKASSSNFASNFPQREVSKGSIKVDNRYAYFIIPHTNTTGICSEYVLRLFTKSTIKLQPILETYTQIFRSTWQQGGMVDTSGGPLLTKEGRSNRTWCQNPQYALFLPSSRKEDSTTVKVVLKRLGPTKLKKETLGLVVVKPTVDLPSTRRKRLKPPKKAVLLSTGRLPPTQPSNLSMAQLQDNSNSTGNLQIDRKLQIQPEEWAIISYFSNVENSCTLLRELSTRFCERGLIVSPMMDAEVDGDFQLEFHSDLPINVRKLEESNMQTIGSSWTENTAGGCHINPSQWRKNPKFVLQLHGDAGEKVDVNINLCRPENTWARLTKRDPVSCMIGFYILPTTRNAVDKNLGIKYSEDETFQTNFVPMSQVATPLGFTMEILDPDQCYIIVPCCYGTGWVGDFSLSVAAECEFSFMKWKSTR
eukprot:GSMAST32.ASY1.ANO1.1230.1 assembled CDS